MELIVIFVCNFFFILLKSFQQQNVIFRKRLWVIPTSYLMAFMETYVIAYVAITGFSLHTVIAIGTGSGLGCLSGMYLHLKLHKLLKRKDHD